MKTRDLTFKQQRGQILVLSIVFLGLLSSLLVGFFHFSFAVREKIRLQISADAAVLSALNCEANALNTIAMTNRAILANDALAAQLNALVSESSFYRKLAERFSRLLQFIPYVGPISRFLANGTRTLEMISKRTAALILPLANFSNKSLSTVQYGIQRIFPYHTFKAAQLSLEENMPEAQITPFSRASLIQQARSLQNNLVNLEKYEIEKIRMETMDRYSKKRNWRISVAGISPAKKTGNTMFNNGDLLAKDKLKMKVISGLRLRWKTVLSSKSYAKDFGYSPPVKIIDLLKTDPDLFFTLGITVQSNLSGMPIFSPSSRNKIVAISAGALVYRRASNTDELPNTLNPFWKTTLIPVSSETTFKKILPPLVLKEIRH